MIALPPNLRLRCSRVSFAFTTLILVLVLPGWAKADDRLNVLLLDYNAPIEHDVLLSHLCVEPCTRSGGCPDELVKAGVDYFSDDFAVFRPGYLGSDAGFVVSVYKDRHIDFLSISGHHASGFSGDSGKGRFYLDELGYVLRDVPGRDAFFSTPSFVLLQGCWTDVKSGFDGDPIEYVRHIIEDTTVRAGQSERLLAAVHQMAGEDDAYRELFPNACILGYDGTQVPGGLLEIYGQINNFLRGLRGVQDGTEPPPARFAIAEARRNGTVDALNRSVDRECLPRGWPCNLCRADAGYRPLAAALAQELRAERSRLKQGEARRLAAAQRMETMLEHTALYNNSSWACSTLDPSTRPIYPQPIDRAPYIETFVKLLMIDLGQIRGDARARIESELVHLLGSTELDPDTRTRLRLLLTSEDGTIWRRRFQAETLPILSSFRQRDYFDFLAEIACADCLDGIFSPETARVVRENAASQLRPAMGRDLYERALADPSPRVRWLSATRLDATLGPEILDLARRDDDERVREAVQAALSGPAEQSPSESLVVDPAASVPEASGVPEDPAPTGVLSTLDFEEGAGR